ncbi:DUF6716 putative glycosyltransferase [Mesorhizobium sp. B2-6-2]|uniref:DUF6716 putative glycosyltransferase n=1 Tax=Mesorhizobium sp. B2-6-2 TaxID=2589915 RepID=UPI001128FB25|nr:DUF6716 putative glycosyltransferase [Mesorhizobium sp. B2-6-2]TPJ77790.1 hypothetical protein FJ419_15415 [Mesorhizobium sp. B2-6-2]
MANIVFTGISARSIMNWYPALEILKNRGHRVEAMLLPHLPDPDSQNLDRHGYQRIGVLPITEHLSRIDPAESRSLAIRARDIIQTAEPDMLLLTTCHAGPEAELAGLFMELSVRPTIVGCQHGFVQNWEVYWSNFHFDYFLVFGQYFQRFVPDTLRQRVLAAGLSKLDSVTPAPRPDFTIDQRPILFAAQSIFTAELHRTLIDLAAIGDREIVVRPHPEFRESFRKLAERFRILDVEEALDEQIARCSLLVTTGSTVALEALAAGIPVVVLPEQRGHFYQDLGIVTDRVDAADILRLASLQSGPQWRLRVRDFLQQTTGSSHAERSVVCADCIEAILVGPPQASPQEV